MRVPMAGVAQDRPTPSPLQLLRAARTAALGSPLTTVLAVAAIARLVAAFFSRGYLATDDHHVLVVAANKLASGIPLQRDYDRSVLYPGATALVMSAVRALGGTVPAMEILVVRLAHAVLSLGTVYFVYRILEYTRGRDAALLGGLLVAAYFPMPAVSVHQLEEAVCLTPLLGGCWWMLRAEQPQARSFWLATVGGAALAVALVIRNPLASFVGPFVVLALLRRGPVGMKLGLVAGLALVFVLEGWSNVLINGEWFYSFRHRLGLAWQQPWQLATQSGYAPSGAPWQYVLTLLAAFLPPFSILFLAAAVRGGRTLPWLGLPTLIFLIAHSFIANKQERFLLPVLPVILLLGAAGMEPVRTWFAQHRWSSVYRGLWVWFWVLNLVLLTIVSLSYSKKDRVAPFVTVQRVAKGHITGVWVLQYSGRFMVPVYYLGRPQPPIVVVDDRRSLSHSADSLHALGIAFNYAILYSDSLDADRARLAAGLGRPLQAIDTVTPSLGDWLAHTINPRRNKTHVAMVFAVQ